MTWTVNYLPEAQDELESFDKAQQKTIQKAIKKSNKIHCPKMKAAMESH